MVPTTLAELVKEVARRHEGTPTEEGFKERIETNIKTALLVNGIFGLNPTMTQLPGDGPGWDFEVRFLIENPRSI